MKFISRLVASLALVLALPAAAQVQAPVYKNSGGTNVGAQGVVVLNADGTAGGRASMATGQAAVTTSSTLVVAARTGRHRIILSPTSSVVYYVGNTGVTSSTGTYVAAGASITLDTAAAIYAVGASNVTISYVEIF